jgi:hypothetical protein
MAKRYEPTNEHEPAQKFGRPQLYPWDEWFDGAPYMLTRGEDFTSQMQGMKATIYKEAQRRGHEVAVTVDKAHERFMIQAYAQGEERPKLPAFEVMDEVIAGQRSMCEVCSNPLRPDAEEFGVCIRPMRAEETPGLYNLHTSELVYAW